jgi:hypothetical protein
VNDRIETGSAPGVEAERLALDRRCIVVAGDEGAVATNKAARRDCVAAGIHAAHAYRAMA